MQRILSTVFTSKELEPETTEETPEAGEEKAEGTYEELREKIFTDLGAEEMHKAFGELVEMVKSIAQRLDEHDQRLQEAERSEDEKIAKTLTDPFAAYNWKALNTSTEKPDNAEDIKDKALGEKPVDGIDHKEVTLDDNPLSWVVNNMLSMS